MAPAYLQAVSHDDHTGVSQGTEQLLRGPLLLLSVVLLLCLRPEQTWVMECMDCPSSPIGSRAQGKEDVGGVGVLSVLPWARPTLRVSFLETLVVGEVHSLSDPLHSLYSACRRENMVLGVSGYSWGCQDRDSRKQGSQNDQKMRQ